MNAKNIVAILIVLAASVVRPLQPAQAAFSEANGMIVFSNVTRQIDAEISVINPDGTGQQVVRSIAGRALIDSVWSPDGNRIVFADGPSPCCFWDLWIMNADGSHAQFLTFGNSRYPSWSPDSEKIAFTRDAVIVVMNADGSNLRSLTNSSSRNHEPNWSPDGEKITF